MKKVVMITCAFLLIPSPSYTHTKENSINDYERVNEYIKEISSEYDIDEDIVHAVIWVESRYDCEARNRSSSAKGIMQVLRGTASDLNIDYSSLDDCRTGILAGVRYLREAFDRHGDGCEGISAYNRGIYAPSACTWYGEKVLSRLEVIRSEN